MSFVLIFFVTLVTSVVVIRLSIPIAISIGLVDKPGGHKLHDDHVPLVGGVAIYVSVALSWLIATFFNIGSINSIFVAATGLLFVIGLIDDRVQLSVKLRFGVQALAALMLVYSQVILVDLGYLQFGELFVLGWFAIPFTVFATLGAINATNMVDGVDGLAGLLSFAILSLLLVVAFTHGTRLQILIILCVLGSLAGFLLFNMPWKGREKAHIFMGDAGSTILGFLFAYLFISLSQGKHRAMSPVTVLWLFAVPLMDTAGVAIRRIWLGKSPFAADRGHLHHLLSGSGFCVRHTVAFIVLLQLALGAIGLAGYYLHVPETLMLVSFCTAFMGYLYLIIRPWRMVPKMRVIHRKSGLIVSGVRHVYVRCWNHDVTEKDIDLLLDGYKDNHHYEIFTSKMSDSEKTITYALIDAKKTDDVKALIAKIKKNRSKVATSHSLGNDTIVRQFIVRASNNDKRIADHSHKDIGRRGNDRRSSDSQLIYSSQDSGAESESYAHRAEDTAQSA